MIIWCQMHGKETTQQEKPAATTLAVLQLAASDLLYATSHSL